MKKKVKSDKIESKIPSNVVLFFKQRGYYIPDVSYKIIAESGQEIPSIYHTDSELCDTVFELPFEHHNKDAESIAKKLAIRSVKSIYKNRRISNPKLSFMINTSSLPIKVKYDKNGKGSRNEIYIKAPDTSRLIGKYLYNMISGFKSMNFMFNENAIIEEGIHGNTLAVTDESLYINSEKYKEGIVRANVHADFMYTFLDILCPSNRIIGSNQETVLFDFNNTLIIPAEGLDCSEYNNILLHEYIRQEGFMTDKLLDVYKSERINVAHRILKYESNFFKVISLAGTSIIDEDGKSLDQQVKESFKFDNMSELFAERIMQYHFS